MKRSFQRLMIALHKVILRRGHTRVVRSLATIFPGLTSYRARLKNGDEMYLDLRETMCMAYFFGGGLDHEPGVLSLLEKVLTTGGTFVDVGANVGYYTRIASQVVGCAGRVVACEPMPSAFRLLKLNAAEFPQATIYPLAIGKDRGSASFWVRSQGDTSSLLNTGGGTQISVNVLTLDMLLADCESVDVIKIDVEGTELDVLRGAVSTISRTGPVIVFEYLEMYCGKSNVQFGDFQVFFAQFKAWDYRLYGLSHHSTGFREATDSFTDFVAVPSLRLKQALSCPYMVE